MSPLRFYWYCFQLTVVSWLLRVMVRHFLGLVSISFDDLEFFHELGRKRPWDSRDRYDVIHHVSRFLFCRWSLIFRVSFLIFSFLRFLFFAYLSSRGLPFQSALIPFAFFSPLWFIRLLISCYFFRWILLFPFLNQSVMNSTVFSVYRVPTTLTFRP